MPGIPPQQEISVYIGHKLRSARKLRGYNQADFGKALATPVSFQQIQKYEKGTSHVSVARLVEFSKILELPLSYFLEDLESLLPEPKSLPQKDELALLEVYRKFDPLIREELSKFIIRLSNIPIPLSKTA